MLSVYLALLFRYQYSYVLKNKTYFLNQTDIFSSLFACKHCIFITLSCRFLLRAKDDDRLIWYHNDNFRFINNPFFQKAFLKVKSKIWGPVVLCFLLNKWAFTILYTKIKSGDGQKKRWYKRIHLIPSLLISPPCWKARFRGFGPVSLCHGWRYRLAKNPRLFDKLLLSPSFRGNISGHP